MNVPTNAGINESIKVYIRQRPDASPTLDVKDGTTGVKSIADDKKSVVYYNTSTKVEQKFAVDQYFDETSTQKDVFETIAHPILKSALMGYSGTILAYGPTGSGKTHTMRGVGTEHRGIIPRCIEVLLEEKAKAGADCELWASYLQLYCENITDLLSSGEVLNIRDKSSDSNDGVYVEGLSRVPLQSIDNLIELLRRGDENRNTAATNMNEFSSRSHAVLMVKILLRDCSSGGGGGSIKGNDMPAVGAAYTESTLMLVDLAGSERASASEGRNSLRLEEAKAINLSLSALGNVMNALATASSAGGAAHIPYRDSKLTRLLQGCIGGGARTAVVVTIAPGTDTAGESLAALRFASRASKVKVMAKVKRYKDYEALYKEMKARYKQLELNGEEGGGGSNTRSTGGPAAGFALREELKNKELQLEQQALEISILKQQLQSLSNTNHPSNMGAQQLATDGGGTEALDTVESLQKQHALALETAHRQFQAKLSQMSANEQKALREVSTLQQDLKQERERSLATMKSVREISDRQFAEEKEFKSRISDLLNELALLRDRCEDLERQNEKGLQDQLESERAVVELQTALLQSVSIEKVKEMEKLFLDTVTNLSNRVQMLEREGQNGQSQGGAHSSNAGSSNASRSVSHGRGAGSDSGIGAGISGKQQVGAGAGSREVRMEPGGRIRAGGSHNAMNRDGVGSVLNSSSVGNETSSAPPRTMQYSASSPAVPDKKNLW